MASPKKTLKHADGTAVTAQEAHDAFMNTHVLIVDDKTSYEANSMEWYDNNSAQNDPSNVCYVKLCTVYDNSGTASIRIIEVGDSSLVPA